MSDLAPLQHLATRRILGIFKTGTIHSIGGFLTKLAMLMMVPVLSELPRTDTGLLGLVDTSEQFLIALMILGQGQAFLREYKETEDEAFRARLISTMVWFFTGTALVLGLILWAAQDFFRPFLLDQSHPLVGLAYTLMLSSLALRGYQSFAINYLRASGQPLRIERFNIVSALLYVGGSAALVYGLNASVQWLLFSRLLLLLPLLLGIFIELRPYLHWAFDAALLKKTLRYGVPFTLAAVAYPVLNFADRNMLKMMLGSDVNGIYEISYKYGMIPGMLLAGPFLQAWQPAMYDPLDPKTRETVYQRVMGYYTWMACVLWLGLSVYSHELLVFFSKPAYYEGHMIIPFVAASNVFYGLGWIVMASLAVQARTLFIGVWTALAAGLNIGLNWVWIPKFGMMGAAYATTLAFVWIFIGFAVYAWYHTQVSFPYGKFMVMLAFSLLGFWLIHPIEAPSFWLQVFYKACACLPVVLGLSFLAGVHKLLRKEVLASFLKPPSKL